MTKYQAPPALPTGLVTGNAADATATRGWIAGAFIAPARGPLHTDGVEVKWGVTPAGEQRVEWTTHESRATICILISGEFTILTPDGDATLAEPGDYVAWGPGVTHSWRAEQDSVTVTVRWPATTPGRKPCRRWAPWRCDLLPTSTLGWVKKCVYCGRETID